MTIETQCCPLCGLMKGECNHNQLGERPDAAPPMDGTSLCHCGCTAPPKEVATAELSIVFPTGDKERVMAELNGAPPKVPDAASGPPRPFDCEPPNHEEVMQNERPRV